MNPIKHQLSGINITTKNTVGNVLNAIAVVTMLGWGIGYLGFERDGPIHLLLFIAILAVFLRVIQDRNLF